MLHTLRAALPEDRPAIQSLMITTIAASIEPAQHSAVIENVTRNLEFWARDPKASLHFVAEAPHGIVGVVLVKEFWNLCSLFVAPEYQGRGIGTQLVRTAVDLCRERSPIGALNLNAAPSAIGFYTALGFVRRESRQALPPGHLPMQLLLLGSEA